MNVKRIICAVLVLCLLPAFAFADLFDEAILYYDAFANQLGVDQLPENFTDEAATTGMAHRTYNLPSSIKVIYSFDNNEVCGVSVVCIDDNYLDFLGVCCAGAFSVMKQIPYFMFGDILTQFLEVRSGKETEVESGNNYAYQVFALNNGIICFSLSVSR